MAGVLLRRRAIGAEGSFRPVRDWIDQLSFRARTTIIIVVFMLTMLAMMDNSAQLLAELGQAVFESAGQAVKGRSFFN